MNKKFLIDGSQTYYVKCNILFFKTTVATKKEQNKWFVLVELIRVLNVAIMSSLEAKPWQLHKLGRITLAHSISGSTSPVLLYLWRKPDLQY